MNNYVNTENLVTGVSELHIRRCSNFKKYMFLQKENKKLIKITRIYTRAHDAVVFETCTPKIEKYKKGCIYRGVNILNSLPSVERNIDSYEEYNKFQHKWRMDVTI